jgi:hypothetical protein
MDAPASAGNYSEIPIRASCPRVATEPDDLHVAARAADTTASRPRVGDLERFSGEVLSFALCGP